jgi:hypothetical protein
MGGDGLLVVMVADHRTCRLPNLDVARAALQVNLLIEGRRLSSLAAEELDALV